MRRLPLVLSLSLLAAASSAQAQQSQDFMAGRLFQVALESAPTFSAQGSPTFGTLTGGAAQTVEQTLAAGTCYTWIAVGDSGQADLDMTVTVNGATVSADAADDDWPIASYCAPGAAAARIDLTMYSGSGEYAFNTYSRTFGLTDPIELNMAFLAELIATGMIPQGPLARGTLGQGAEQTYPLPVSGGQCYTVLGAGGPGVRDLDLFLVDGAGQIVSQDVAADNAPVVDVCPTSNANYTLRVRMYDGAGDYGWQAFASAF